MTMLMTWLERAPLTLRFVAMAEYFRDGHDWFIAESR